MVDRAVLERLADTLPDTGEPAYPDRLELRRALTADSLLRLEEMCARRAYPAWSEAFEDDNVPLDLMEAALADPGDSSLPARFGEVKTHLDDQFMMGDEYFAGIYAGFACWAVARDAIGDITAQPSGAGELEIPPDQWSPCFFASLAEAGGAVWEDVGDNGKRREFWRWYLLEAVPAAEAMD